MRNKVIVLFTILGISLASLTPARAQFIPWGYGGGFGYSAAIAGIGIATGALAGAAIANSYPYGYGYAPVPVYVTPRPYAPAVRKQIIIKNSPGARVYEEDDIFGW